MKTWQQILAKLILKSDNSDNTPLITDITQLEQEISDKQNNLTTIKECLAENYSVRDKNQEKLKILKKEYKCLLKQYGNNKSPEYSATLFEVLSYTKANLEDSRRAVAIVEENLEELKPESVIVEKKACIKKMKKQLEKALEHQEEECKQGYQLQPFPR